MQKAIEEAKRFVCTTKDRIVKDAKEFIQNVDWKKVAIGVAATAAITLAVVATGGAAAPVLIGAAVGAGISTGTTVVSGVIQGKSPVEIAQDASGAFMWGAIGGAVGGGTTSLLESVGSSTAGNYVRQNLIEGGMDTAVDLAQSASNGGLTPQGVVTSVVTNMVGAFINAPDTPSTTRNQLVDGVTDNRSVKNAVADSDYGAHDVIQYEKLKSSYAADEIVNADRVGSGLKSAPYHRAASFVSEEQLSNGRTFEFTNGDGRKMTMLQTEGEVNGKSGIFEYILNPNGQVEHQLFKPGAGITGPTP